MIEIKPSNSTIYILATELIVINFIILAPLIASMNELNLRNLDFLLPVLAYNILISFLVLRIYKNIYINDNNLSIRYSYLSFALKPFEISIGTINKITFDTMTSLAKYSSSIRIEYSIKNERKEIRTFSYRLADKRLELKKLFNYLDEKQVQVIVDGNNWEPHFWENVH